MYIQFKLSIHWCGSRLRFAVTYRTILWLLPLSHHIVAPALIYMVKFKIIARNLTTWGDAPSQWGPGWANTPGTYDYIHTVVDACRAHEATLPEPWQFSIIVVEFDCLERDNNDICFRRPWMSELTSEKPVVGGRDYFNAAQLAFVGGFDIGRWGDCPTHTHPWSCVA